MNDRQTPRPTAARVNALLKRYRDKQDLKARNELVLLYAPMVRYIVFKKIRELPPHCDAEDYVTAGMEALIGAADRYDLSRGTSFEQYAWTRVLGAVVDEMRREDWAPRAVRRFAREADRTAERLTARDGRPPSDSDLAQTLGLSVEELRRKRHEVQGAEVVSLNAPLRTAARTPVERQELVPDSEGLFDPASAAVSSEAKDLFRRAFARLPERDREVAVKLYVANMTLREVGDDLGVSESRVCQIHSQLRKRLREELADHRELFDAMA